MRYFVYFAYKGTAYHGSQTQPNGLTVQEVLERAFSLILQSDIRLTFAGRTDAGVHAEMMVAHFDYEKTIDSHSLVQRINSFLPDDIALSKIVRVTENAHARFDAVSRKYEYRCIVHKSPFYNKLSVVVPATLNFAAMNDAATILLQTTDFASFCKLHTDVKTTICKVTKAEWQKKNDIWVFSIQADRFLRNMVRAIVGTLFEVGRGRMNKEQFTQVIKAGHRTAAGQSAPAQALFLVDIEYPNNLFLSE